MSWSWIEALAPIVAEKILDAAERIAKGLWGGEPVDEAAAAAIIEIKRKGLEALVERMELELANQRTALGLPAEADKLIAGTQDVVAAFEIRAGRRTVPPLDYVLEEVDELPAPDFDSIDTPLPDGSSER